MDTEIERMINDLEHSERVFARSYLSFREQESRPGRPLSVEDARANAVLFMEANHLPLPEVCRFRLHAALNIERAIEPS